VTFVNFINAIVSDGDVVFVVGDEKRQLKAHSLFLRTVSIVFNAMLGHRYREGANLSSDMPKNHPFARGRSRNHGDHLLYHSHPLWILSVINLSLPRRRCVELESSLSVIRSLTQRKLYMALVIML